VSKIVAAYRGIRRLSSMRPVVGAPPRPFTFCLIYQIHRSMTGIARTKASRFLSSICRQRAQPRSIQYKSR
jgi:hypothetical protein